jgi:uncharacterized membrane protein YoaK (UPF0700 family)
VPMSDGQISCSMRAKDCPSAARFQSTYIIGTLTGLTEQVVSRMRLPLPLEGSGEQRAKQRTAPNRNPAILACVWMVYGLGALVSGAAMLRWPSGTVVVPIVLVALVITTAIVRFRR